MSLLRNQYLILEECGTLHLKPWQCPPILFIAMGVFSIVMMLTTYTIATRYTDEPQIAALAVIAIAIVSLVIGNLIINGFNKMAEAHRMQSEFVSIVSHQLRSPLSILKWTIDMASREIQEENKHAESLSESIATLTVTTENMIRLVNALLDVSRIETGTLTLKKERVVIDELIRASVVNFATYAKASNVTITTRIAPELPIIVGDHDRLQMAVQTLIDNAIRYTVGGGTVTVSAAKEDQIIVISVQDQGLGIPESEQKRIFEKFFRAEHAPKLQTEGTGIGLYISHAIVRAMGGAIRFTSTPGKGSTFWLTLPLLHYDNTAPQDRH
ncbi:MAG: HAMP domain-containing histidine kinase [Candidatus Sungbacteria bacterium]|nr:HAMP domain-containing histidine kinase [Candidatus Sungbacteria bacterium]